MAWTRGPPKIGLVWRHFQKKTQRFPAEPVWRGVFLPICFVFVDFLWVFCMYLYITPILFVHLLFSPELCKFCPSGGILLENCDLHPKFSAFSEWHHWVGFSHIAFYLRQNNPWGGGLNGGCYQKLSQKFLSLKEWGSGKDLRLTWGPRLHSGVWSPHPYSPSTTKTSNSERFHWSFLIFGCLQPKVVVSSVWGFFLRTMFQKRRLGKWSSKNSFFAVQNECWSPPQWWAY